MKDSKQRIFGIDPAPSKGLAVWSDDGLSMISASESRRWIEEKKRSCSSFLISWDAPISFNPTVSYSQRPVEREVSAFFRRADVLKLIDGKAVSVRPFSGCPHWSITCDVIGLPFNSGNQPLQIARTPADLEHKGYFVIEVHPAVTLAIWWITKGIKDTMPRYKGAPDACRKIAVKLGLPQEAAKSDDSLDAFVAYTMAIQFIDGDAIWFGDVTSGGFVLPSEASEIIR